MAAVCYDAMIGHYEYVNKEHVSSGIYWKILGRGTVTFNCWHLADQKHLQYVL